MYEFEPVGLENLNLNEFNNFNNKTIFTTPEWIRFIEADSGAKPIILRITRDQSFIGYFSGLTIKKFGVTIIGSPFSGWSTCFMGFDCLRKESMHEIIRDLKTYLFNEFNCDYIEIIDRNIDLETAESSGLRYVCLSTLELKIDQSDVELFKVFETNCRNRIRQFERRGASIEEAYPDERFAEEYFEQLKDVFAKQGLVPTYGVDKVKCLLDSLAGSGKLLCLRVKNPEGRSIATSIFVGHNYKFFFWGGASLRSSQSYRPNEYMLWYAIKYWRARGCTVFDMVGVRDYKKKFSPNEIQYIKIIIPKYKILLLLRNLAEKMYFFTLKARGALINKRGSN